MRASRLAAAALAALLQIGLLRAAAAEPTHAASGASPEAAKSASKTAMPAALPAGGAREGGVPQLLEVTPSGTVKQVEQITARFATAMVALGDPRANQSPIRLDCTPAVSGNGHWVDSRTFADDLAQKLPGGVRCTVEASPGLRDLAGRALESGHPFAFSTGGPSILSSRPAEDSEIAEDQAFVVVLDAQATPASVESHASFAVDGVAERIGVAIAGPDVVKAILATDPDWKPEGPILVLQARQRFPAEAKVRLVWGAGIESPGGVATEQDQTLAFQTRPPFRGEIRCERDNPRAGCVPIASISLRLTASVEAAAAAKIALVGADGTRYPQAPPDSPDPEVSRVTFPGPFAPSSTLRLEVPADLHDDAGRTLANAAELASLPVKVDPLPPLAKFAARFGILESKADPALPVTIRGLEPNVKTRLLEFAAREQGKDAPSGAGGASKAKPIVAGNVLRLPSDRPSDVIPWLLRVSASRRDRSVFAGRPDARDVKSFDLPQPLGPEMQVVGVPLEKPGVYVVELESRALGRVLLDRDAPMYVAAAALVTDLAVHFEWGRERSLVWVTTLENARPVEGADVAVHDCAGKVLWRGTTDKSGIAWIDSLPGELSLPTCKEPEAPGKQDEEDESAEQPDFNGSRPLSNLTSGLFVSARLGDDLGFVHTSWNEGIEPFRFNLPSDSYQGPYAAHTVLARALLRAGDVAYMKHVFRAETLAGFGIATPAQRPSRVLLRHLGSGSEIELPLTWADDGSAETTWQVPREAKLGRYQIVLSRPARSSDADAPTKAGHAPRPTPTPPPPYADLGRGEDMEREWVTGELRVEDFRVPLLRTTLSLPAVPQVAPSTLPVDVAVSYLAGGGASGLPITVRSRIVSTDVKAPDDLEGFDFGNGAVTPGITRHDAGNDESDTDGASGSAGGGALGRGVFQRSLLRLDAAGTARVTIDKLPPPPRPEKLLVEVELRDPNGETQTASSSATLWPSAQLVGLKADFRRDQKRRLLADVAVIDAERKPVAGVRAQVEAFERLTYSVRQRVVGGFYSYQDVEEVRRLKTLCRGKTDAHGLLHCKKRAPADGNLIVQARIADDQHRVSAAHADVWVPGARDEWFNVADTDRIDVVPEQRRYQASDTARLQVRMPFRHATALVSLVREGVLDARVVELSGKDPAVDVPIVAADSPNVYVQVLALRGRVANPPPTALVDLGKPAFKLGIAELEVGWQPHELHVKVLPEREVYKVRDRAHVEIDAAPADGAALPAGATAAVAAVDEGLLELLPNTSVDLLRAMMGRRGDAVQTSTAQMQVVGKRHFGKKAAPVGGGGGRQVTRELFDTLLLWRGSVPLDQSGHATLDVPLNDSLTSFRIVAVATAGSGLFGTGEATIRSTQDLMVLSGLPPLVRSEDRFRAQFTVRNTTQGPLDVSVSGRADALADPALAPQSVHLGAGEAQIVGWNVEIPVGVAEVAYAVEATATSGPRDSLVVKQRVVPAVPVRTLQSTLDQWTPPGPLTVAVERPAGAVVGIGGVEVGLAPSLVAGLDGVRDWMRAYPYVCLEQQVSRAVALGDPELWRDVAGRLPSYQDGDGLLKFFPSMTWGSEALTAYVLSVTRAAGLALPKPVEEAAERGLRSFVDGTLSHRDAGVGSDLTLRKLAAVAALASAGADDPALLSGITIEPQLWPTASVLDWWSTLLHMKSIPDRARRRADAEAVLRARLQLGGTVLAFAPGGPSLGGGPFASEDVDAVRLVLLALEADAWHDDQPRLMRGALARQQRGVWSGTVANAWGVVATTRFARAFEAGPVAGTTEATLGDEHHALDWAHDPAGGTLDFAWPPAKADLQVAHQGGGRPWLTVRSRAALPLSSPLVAGYRIVRKTTAIEPKSPDHLSVGDALRVRLEIEASSDLSWVVVDDPVPAGSSFLARGFATDSAISGASPTPSADAPATPTYEERRFEAYRAYFERVPAGRFVVEYSIRLNQAGTFQLPPTHVEALYAPEVMGESPNAPVEVVE